MTERGKYHGQRLKAQDVLRLYAAGERDFRGAILRGCKFRGADLSGADFSGTDIRSARFVDATLQNAKFCGAQAGLQRRWWLGQFLLVVILAGLAGALQGYTGVVLGYWLTAYSVTDRLGTIAAIVVILVTFFAIARQGFTIKALGSVAVAFAVVVAGTGAFATAFTFAFTFAVAVAGAVAGAFAFAVAFTFAVAGTGTFAVAVAFTFPFAVAVAVPVAVAGTNTFAGAVAFTFPFAGAVAGAVAVAVASLFLSIYINRCIHKRDQRFENLRIIRLAFAALGGTTFSGADLSGASFSHAYLQRTNFADSLHKPTILTQVRWHQSQKLDRARLGFSILQDHRVCHLLTTLKGTDQDLSHANLQSANLAGATLHGINLSGANLNGATLEGTELHRATLTGAQCIATNFTAAHLTGACLEAWNIDETTVLKAIDCQYIFLKEHPNTLGGRERLPHNPDRCFEPGDFEKYFREVMDEVKLLIRGGVDPQAFRIAFQALMTQHQILPDHVRGFQRKGSDVLISVTLPPNQAKPDVAQTFEAAYEQALPAATAQALLEAERRNKQDLIQLANKSIDSISHVLSNLTIQTTAMNQSHNPNTTTGDGSFYAGGDVNLTGSTLNLGEISGQVSNQINQLPDAAPTPDQPSLKTLLLQLKAAIETDTELSDDEKAEALGEVAKLVKAGSNPKESTMQRLAKRATATLKSIAEPLTDASKLATACTSLLPMILALF